MTQEEVASRENWIVYNVRCTMHMHQPDLHRSKADVVVSGEQQGPLRAGWPVQCGGVCSRIIVDLS